MKVRVNKDLTAGLMFCAFGLFAYVIALDYPMGITRKMGPGYFPQVLGAILALLGLVVALRGWQRGSGWVSGWSWRGLLLVSAGVIAFVGLLKPLGLIPATIALVVISALADTKPRVIELVVLCGVLALIADGVFLRGLGLPLEAWSWSW
jgi:putative tricarboxylic transport membrane protein